jgi:DNA-binding CsgD family transcriptional regulator
VADATQALALLDGERWCVLAGLPRGVLLLAMTEQGRHREVEEELARPVLGTFARSPYGLVYLRARGRHHLATGSLQAALSDFRSCGEILGSWGLELPGLLPWRIDVAEALLGLGQHEEAEHWLAEQLRLTPSERSRTRGIALRLGATTMPLARRGTVLRESATVLERCGDTLELARTLGTLAHTYQLTGNLKYGRATMRRAEKMARNSDGHWALAQLSAHSVGPAVQAPPREQHVAGGSLSLAEVKVARLAAQGYTNREIAHTLYVTVSTVEQHLTRIYRKLSIRRRSELSHLVGSR